MTAEESADATGVTVVGIGNTVMGDDGVGTVVARLLAARPEANGITIVEGETAGMGLIRHFRTNGPVLVIDAIDAGSEPGAIFRFDPDEAGVTQLRSYNIHGMGLPYLVTNARLLGHDPKVTVFAIQVRDIAPVEGLSPPVADAAEKVTTMVAEELCRLRGGAAEAV